MPTVFDSPLAQLILAQQMGAAGGPEGGPVVPPRPPLARAIAGPEDERLTPEENQRIQQQSLLRAGATGLLASSNLQRGGLLGVLGQAALAGQRFASDEAAAILQSRPEPDELQTQVITRPDGSMDLINKLTGETITNLGKPTDERAEPRAVRRLNGERVLASWDPKKGAYVGLDGQLLVGAIPDPDEAIRGVSMKILGDDGRFYSILVDPTTGEQIGPARLADVANGIDPKDFALVNELRLRLENIKQTFERRSGRPFGIIEEALERRTLPFPNFINEVLRSQFTSDEIQGLGADADAFVQIMVKAREGGRPSDKDREFILQFTRPVASDNTRTIALKIRRMEQFIELMEANPGAAFDQAIEMAGGSPSGSPRGGFFPPKGER